MEQGGAGKRRLLWMGTAFLLAAAALSAAEPALSLSTELEELRRLETRLLLRGRDSSFLYLDRCALQVGAAKAELPTIGFTCPWLTFGPVLLEGMFAQLYNPLGQAAGSRVFEQEAGLHLDIGLDSSGRRGLALEVLSGLLGLVALRREESGTQAGATLQIPLGDALRIGLLYLLCDSPADPGGAEAAWFSDTPALPGGPLSQAGLSLHWVREPAALSLVCGISGAQWLPAGSFTTLHLRCCFPPLELAGLAACSEGFITPEGRLAQLKYRLGLRLAWEAASGFSLSAAWGRKVHPPAPQPGLFLENEDRLSLSLSAFRPGPAGRSLSWQAGAAGSLHCHGDGRKETDLALDCGARLATGSGEAACTLSEHLEGPERWRGALELSGVWRPAGERAELAAELGLDLHPRPGWRLRLDVELVGAAESGRRGRFYTCLQMNRALPFSPAAPPVDVLELLSLGLGWEVRIPVGRLPAQVRRSSSLAVSK